MNPLVQEILGFLWRTRPGPIIPPRTLPARPPIYWFGASSSDRRKVAQLVPALIAHDGAPDHGGVLEHLSNQGKVGEPPNRTVEAEHVVYGSVGGGIAHD